MQLSLAGYWQISPLTDLTVPQNDIFLPAPLSAALPSELSEEGIAEQEWHLMHDIELDDAMLSYPAIDLIVGGIDYFSEVRINGEAVFDCDSTQLSYRKDIKRYLRPGRNRFEILFLEADEDFLLEDEVACPLGLALPKKRDKRMGVWEAPFLHFVNNVRLDYISTEQIWHQGGGCEFRVDLSYHIYSPGLVSARVKFNGMTLTMPLDLRSQESSALFQVDAPLASTASDSGYYLLEVELDGQKRTLQVELSPEKCVSHYPA
ncbi:hypothetical protein L3Q72_12825 [Vibrio sp. JC009]|uniref:glycosyl hydrolase 2 galactose-binding domain-containing protein n=1 Tax=Vibrio sp. JC009 TaxID=2912314 RepID=UPI0023B009EC|nr:hypothetical protein [Vibrio sp. JC009]WED21499.1 hypothetical protein L3Q72_12825 [Vibrio sp. JC009]